MYLHVFYLHCLGAMDTFARGLRNAVELQQQGVMEKCVQVCRTTYTLHIPQCIVWNGTINLYTVFSLGINVHCSYSGNRTFNASITHSTCSLGTGLRFA